MIGFASLWPVCGRYDWDGAGYIGYADLLRSRESVWLDLGICFLERGVGNGIDLFNPTIAYAPSCPGCSPWPVFIARPAGNKKIKWLFNLFETESVYNKQKKIWPRPVSRSKPYFSHESEVIGAVGRVPGFHGAVLDFGAPRAQPFLVRPELGPFPAGNHDGFSARAAGVMPARVVGPCGFPSGHAVTSFQSKVIAPQAIRSSRVSSVKPMGARIFSSILWGLPPS